jgi:NADPH:quinone reductase-like Zn-dependent oxidoreductase
VDSAAKLSMMRAIGFEHVIDYRQEDFTRSGERYDLILDTKTNRSVFDYARVLAPEGRYVTVGGLTPWLLQTLTLGPLVRRRSGKEVRVLALKPNRGMAYLNERIEAGDIEPVIDGPYRFEDLPWALRHFGEGHHKGKVVVEMGVEGAA